MSVTLTRQLEERVRRELPSLDVAQAREMASIIEQLVAAFQPERVYAFGSRARGDVGLDSDADLTVAVTESTEPSFRRSQTARTLLIRRFLIGLDVLMWTHREFVRRAKSGHPAWHDPVRG